MSFNGYENDSTYRNNVLEAAKAKYMEIGNGGDAKDINASCEGAWLTVQVYVTAREIYLAAENPA
jgi:hypothetical protein